MGRIPSLHTIDIGDPIILWGGAPVCTVVCGAASLNSTPQMPGAPSLPNAFQTWPVCPGWAGSPL